VGGSWIEVAWSGTNEVATRFPVPPGASYKFPAGTNDNKRRVLN